MPIKNLPKKETVDVLVRGFPADLLAEVEAFAAADAGKSGKPSRTLAIIELVRRGLHVPPVPDEP
jgi:hypothetical protein